MFELNGLRPKYEFVGYDVRSDLFACRSPGSFPLPLRNITMKHQEVLMDFPRTDLEKFDMVHLQFLATTLVGIQWKRAFGNVMSLLKPGGFLQYVWQILSITSLLLATYQIFSHHPALNSLPYHTTSTLKLC